MSDDDAPQSLDPSWNPIRALHNLTMERALSGTDTPQTIAKRLFEENLPVAVMAIAHLATYSETEVIRLNAAKFVVERTMGPAERAMTQEGKHAWDDIYDDVVEEAEGYVRKNL